MAAERAIEITAGLIDLARAENKVPPTVPKQKICFDEWNVWDMSRAPGEQGAEEEYVLTDTLVLLRGGYLPYVSWQFTDIYATLPRYTLSDALAVSVWLNVFVRQSKHIGMANIAQSVNVISPLMTDKTGITRQTTWWPLFLFSRYMRGSTVAVHLHSGVYDGPTRPEWVRGAMETPWLDVSAALDDDGFVTLAVVNISPDRDIETLVEGIVTTHGEKGQKVAVYTVSGEAVDVINPPGEKQYVSVQEGSWDGQGSHVFPRHSLTMLRWRCQARN